MTSKIKALGLALGAAFAVSVVVASAAQAVPTLTAYDDNGTHTHAVLSSSQTTGKLDKFRITAGKTSIACGTVFSGGTLTTGTSSEFTALPAFGTCEANGLPVMIKTTSCDYRYTISAKTTEHQYTGVADVVCLTPGDTIHIQIWNASGSAVICEYTIEEQNGINGITYTNITPGAGKKYVEIDSNSTNIKAEVTVSISTIICGEAEGTTVSAATYFGEDKVTAMDTENNPLNLTISSS